MKWQNVRSVKVRLMCIKCQTCFSRQIKPLMDVQPTIFSGRRHVIVGIKSHQGRTLGMVCGAEFGGVGRQSLREVGVLGGVLSL